MAKHKQYVDIVGLVGKIAGRVIIVSLVILAVFVTAKYSFSFGQSIFYQKPMEEAPGRDITFVVEEGDTASEVADRLFDEGAVRAAGPLKIQSDLYGVEYLPGEYIINTSMTPKQILSVFQAAGQAGGQ